ncbi:MAG: MBOAT family protein [Acidipila sp.]|nr:MBOAT family protein [Acidipila sp.]
MLFDTPIYFLFLIFVVSLYWRMGWRKQNLFLLVASYFFYGWWDWRFLFLIITSTVVDFYVAKWISASTNPVHRKALLTFSLVLNFTFLGFFKYFDFFLDSFSNFLDVVGVHNIPHSLLRIILPPGISFYTFQEVAYIVDVYFGKLEAADSLLDYALFIGLFPHLIAGPIQRPSHLLPQVQKPRHFDAATFLDGCMLILSGLFRKCVIADNCALLANAYFENRSSADLVGTLIGVYAFAWQIYGDFSGYSDIARGSAQLMGFHFMVNFRQPYLATSLQDFWRRWHISLSTWLRDYLYIPLGGNRLGERRTYANLMATMLLGGLWHGANFTFVIWGGIHGGWLSLERFFQSTQQRIFRLNSRQLPPSADLNAPAKPWAISVWLQRAFIFHIVCFSWIFFRARSLGDAFSILRNLGKFVWIPEYGTAGLFLGCLILLMLLLDLRLETKNEEYFGASMPEYPRVAVGLTLVLLTVLFAAGQANAFIYFQF